MNLLEAKEVSERNFGDFIPPVWPLKTAIACNPFLGMESTPFWEAVAFGEEIFSLSLEEEVNFHLIRWIEPFLDEGQATIPMPERQLGFYRCFLALARFDSSFCPGKREKELLKSLPLDPDEAIAFALERLGISEEEKWVYCQAALAQLPGWAGFIKWRSEWDKRPQKYPVSLFQFLAVRFAITLLLGKQSGQKRERKPLFIREEIEKREKEEQKSLLQEMLSSPKLSEEKKVFGQLVFCIDVRSEPLRRRLEKSGKWETFGFAGFFGLPLSVEKEEPHSSCPVLLQPLHKVWEVEREKGLIGKPIQKLLQQVYRGLKYHFATPFSLAETLGFWSGLWMGCKTIFPNWSYSFKRDLCGSNCSSTLCGKEEIPFEMQVSYAESALRMMGLYQKFAPLVVFCGHGSTTKNNPHASSLNCGACGGNRGGANAKMLALILNDTLVRKKLEERGISIPEETLFIGAEHDTVTEAVTLFDAPSTPVVEELEKELKMGPPEGERRSCDWAEVRPEWGLAKNSSFIVGPRALSAPIDLKGRSFLHSYDWKIDPDGIYLETILTAPMVVASWINTQYFFSTYSPVLYGSGSKITQNVVGKIGVMQGNGSDLMHGLPLQSVYQNDQEPYHEPLRLSAIVYAPRKVIDSIVARQPILQNLFFGAWVHLIAIDPTDHRSYQLQEKGWDLLR